MYVDLKLVRSPISPVVLVEGPDTAGILDDVEDGGDDGDEELEDADHDDRLLEREPAHRGEAGSAPAHDCLSVCCDVAVFFQIHCDRLVSALCNCMML